MKKLNFWAIMILSGLVILVTMPALTAQTTPVQHGKHFVDVNGDGYNDNAPDSDGDGIPNGQDPDYQKNLNATKRGPRYVDVNGDGYNDNAPDRDGDGIPNGQDPDYQRPRDGSGQKYASPFRNGNIEVRRETHRIRNQQNPNSQVPSGNCNGNAGNGGNTNRNGNRP